MVTPFRIITLPPINTLSPIHISLFLTLSLGVLALISASIGWKFVSHMHTPVPTVTLFPIVIVLAATIEAPDTITLSPITNFASPVIVANVVGIIIPATLLLGSEFAKKLSPITILLPWTNFIKGIP